MGLLCWKGCQERRKTKRAQKTKIKLAKIDFKKTRSLARIKGRNETKQVAYMAGFDVSAGNQLKKAFTGAAGAAGAVLGGTALNKFAGSLGKNQAKHKLGGVPLNLQTMADNAADRGQFNKITHDSFTGAGVIGSGQSSSTIVMMVLFFLVFLITGKQLKK